MLSQKPKYKRGHHEIWEGVVASNRWLLTFKNTSCYSTAYTHLFIRYTRLRMHYSPVQLFLVETVFECCWLNCITVLMQLSSIVLHTQVFMLFHLLQLRWIGLTKWQKPLSVARAVNSTSCCDLVVHAVPLSSIKFPDFSGTFNTVHLHPKSPHAMEMCHFLHLFFLHQAGHISRLSLFQPQNYDLKALCGFNLRNWWQMYAHTP